MKMKKLVCAMAIAAVVATTAGISLAGQAPGTGVNESAHDITFLAGNGGDYNPDDFQRVCVFCHTPHNALPNGAVPAPLWNHAPSNVTLEPYTWAAPANAVISYNIDPLVGPSRLCMACHDGVTAVDSHGSAGSAMNGNHAMTRQYTDDLGNIAKRYIEDLAVTHPIGFLYQDAVNARNKDGILEIVTADARFLTTGSVPDNPDTKNRGSWVTGNKKVGDTLYSGYFTCASCHEVHNTNNVASAPALSDGHIPNYFLWAPEEKSTICLSCHIK